MGNTEKQFVRDKQLTHRSYSNPRSSFQRTPLLVPPSLAKVGWQKKLFSEQGQKESPFIADGYIEKHLFKVVQDFSVLPYENLNTSVTKQRKLLSASTYGKTMPPCHVYQLTVHVDSSHTPLF
jgi:hypothetical protein